LAVVFPGGGVISEGGFDFGVEGAQPNTFILKADGSNPFANPFVKMNAPETRGGLRSGFSPVEDVLGVCRQTEIVRAVVEGTIISVVHQKTCWCVHNFPVQAQCFCFFIGEGYVSNGVEVVAFADSRPVKNIEPIVIGRVNEGKQVVAERDFTERITIFSPSVFENRPGADVVEPVRDFYFNFRHCLVLLILKNPNIEIRLRRTSPKSETNSKSKISKKYQIANQK
jgi:hypothetical protein